MIQKSQDSNNKLLKPTEVAIMLNRPYRWVLRNLKHLAVTPNEGLKNSHYYFTEESIHKWLKSLQNNKKEEHRTAEQICQEAASS